MFFTLFSTSNSPGTFYLQLDAIRSVFESLDKIGLNSGLLKPPFRVGTGMPSYRVYVGTACHARRQTGSACSLTRNARITFMIVSKLPKLC